MAAPDRSPMYEWAMRRIKKPANWSREFNIEDSRHFIEVFESLQSCRIREVNLMAPVRAGKSMISEIATCYWRANAPGDHLMLFQDDDIAKQFAETRMMTLLASVPEVEALLSRERNKTRTQEVIYADGKQFVVWGPAVGNLQTFGYRYLTCDELWQWPAGTLFQAKGRLDDYVRMGLDKLFCVSQGGDEGDDWDFQWQSGEQRLWNVPCYSCGHLMYPAFSGHREDGSRWGIRFDEKAKVGKLWDIQRAVETVRFECEKCGHSHADTPQTRARWNLGGSYQTSGGAVAHKKSYRFPIWIVHGESWSRRLEEWLTAMNKREDKGEWMDVVNFIRKKLAEPKSETAYLDAVNRFERFKVTSDPWDGEYVRIVTADKQKDGLYWVTARAWSKAGESRRILFKDCTSEKELQEVENLVKPQSIGIRVRIGERRFVSHRIKLFFVDSNFEPKGDSGVFAMASRNGWGCFRGDAKPWFTHEHEARRGVWESVTRPYSMWSFGDPGENTDGRLDVRAPRCDFYATRYTDKMQEMIESGKWKEPDTDRKLPLEVEYSRQMADEYRAPITNKKTGRQTMGWISKTKNNHARDCGKMQCLAATMLDIL